MTQQSHKSRHCLGRHGEEVELHLLGERQLEVSKKSAPADPLERLRQLRGRLPADFHFNRLYANEEAS